MTNAIIITKDEAITSNLVENSVNEFKGYAQQTAEGIIEMGRIIFESKQKLGNGKNSDFETFCKKIGYESSSSTIKKLNQIGKRYVHLKSQAENLPGSWTTMYEISRLASDTLDELIDDGTIHQNVLGSTIKKYLKNQAGGEEVIEKEGLEVIEGVPNETPSGYTFLCEMTDVNDLALNGQVESIIRNLKQLKLKVQIAPNLKSYLRSNVTIAA